MIEEYKDKAPFVAMGGFGGNFPLRAYSEGYLAAPLLAGISAEYRWPIDRFADALIFNEYGIYGKDFSRLSTSNIKNSYGFGFRVRTPKLFLTRFSMAFHGLQGVTLIFTTRPEY
jgi:outer membrane protein assembly factor BamA